MNTMFDYSYENVLLKVSDILNDYLEGTHSNFDSTERLHERFGNAYLSNVAFQGWVTGRRGDRNFYEGSLYNICELSDDFYQRLINSTEYTGCDCHNIKFEEHQSEVMGLVKQYAVQIFSFWDRENFQQMLTENKIISFSEDYQQIYKDLNEKTIDLKKATEALLYWKDAVSDSLLCNALISLRYLSIMKHI